MVKKLNSTGSLWLDANANAYSYNTQLTGNYKGLSVFNNTFYSRTTRKHQAQFNKNNFNLVWLLADFRQGCNLMKSNKQ